MAPRVRKLKALALLQTSEDSCHPGGVALAGGRAELEHQGCTMVCGGFLSEGSELREGRGWNPFWESWRCETFKI